MSEPAATRSTLARVAARVEDGLLAAALFAIALLPIVEVVLRESGSTGVSGGSAILQHLVLVVGMLGGAVAAREGRSLSLSTVDAFVKGPAKRALAIVVQGLSAGVAAWLALGAWQFVRDEWDPTRELAYGIPLGVVQAILPAGFALCALRIAWRADERASGRGTAFALLAACIAGLAHAPIDPASAWKPLLAVLCVLAFLGAPIFVVLGGVAALLLWSDDSPISAVALDHYALVTNPTLASIPLFTLAGYLLAEGGASKRLVDVFQRCFGAVRGGPAIVTVLVCTFFTSFTGASGVTILALGGLLMPILQSAGYTDRRALGIVTGAGSLGLLLPPCLPVILYAIVAEIPMQQMFLGGVAPSFVLIGLSAWWGVRAGPKRIASGATFDARAAWRSIWAAKWELALPVVALASLFSGLATPVESAALTALYALFTQAVVHRDLSWTRGVPKALAECGLVVGGVLLILGVAKALASYLTFAEVPARLLEWTTASVESRFAFLLLLNVFLLIVGCLMDVFSAIVVVAPLIVPLGAHYGVDPVHLGVIFLANLELGYLTPPVGMNLFLASYRLEKPMSEVYRAVVPMLLVLFFGVLVITYWPALSTWLPSLWSASGG